MQSAPIILVYLVIVWLQPYLWPELKFLWLILFGLLIITPLIILNTLMTGWLIDRVNQQGQDLLNHYLLLDKVFGQLKAWVFICGEDLSIIDVGGSAREEGSHLYGKQVISLFDVNDRATVQKNLNELIRKPEMFLNDQLAGFGSGDDIRLVVVNACCLAEATTAGWKMIVMIEDVSADEKAQNRISFLERELADVRSEVESASLQLAGTMKKLTDKEHQLRELSLRDGLTSLYNHKYFFERMAEEVERARRYGSHIGVIMLDIDHFKIYNDIHGHLMGDDVLKDVASILAESSRGVDIVARYGGEEFGIILPLIGKTESLEFAERIRREIEKKRIPGQENLPDKNLTVSIGVSVFPEDDTDAKTLIRKADEALYIAKRSGRNKVVGYQGDASNV
jgi:diguanylate cyclase (GGDEF)-like protein